MIEVTRFRLREGQDVDAFVSLDSTYQQEFAYQQAGLRRRTVAVGLEGEWLVVALWASKRDATNARVRASESPLAVQHEGPIDPASKSVEYFKELAG